MASRSRRGSGRFHRHRYRPVRYAFTAPVEDFLYPDQVSGIESLRRIQQMLHGFTRITERCLDCPRERERVVDGDARPQITLEPETS